MQPAAGREEALGELHARPAPSIGPRAHITRLVFLLREDASGDAQRVIDRICGLAGAAAPEPAARYHVIRLEGREIRWERHTEFVTYTFVSAGDGRSAEIWDQLTASSGVLSGYGGLVAKIALRFEPAQAQAKPDPTASACAATIAGGRALLTTDFRADADGFVGFEVRHRDLTGEEAGILCQRILEMETYRMLALMALPLARSIGVLLRQEEKELERITRQLEPQEQPSSSSVMFAELNALSAKIEAELATASYRFSAALAYGAIVADRISSLQEARASEQGTMPGEFLMARLSPALRTYTSMQKALADLAQRNARATDLVRTRIDLELAQQNNALLNALNERTRLQTRLQQTVEGLSVAAISYYIVGLTGYAAKGAKEAGWSPLDPNIVMAAAVPLAIIGVWLLVSRVRRKHSE